MNPNSEHIALESNDFILYIEQNFNNLHIFGT